MLGWLEGSDNLEHSLFLKLGWLEGSDSSKKTMGYVDLRAVSVKSMAGLVVSITELRAQCVYLIWEQCRWLN